MAIATEKLRLYIVLTNTARDAIKQHVQDEHAFFNLQKAFVVFIEKLEQVGEQVALTLYFDPQVNKGLAKKFPGRVCIMDGLYDDKSGLVAKSFRTRGIGTPVATNRRVRMLVHFVPTRINGHTYPSSFIQGLNNIPFSKERYDYVNKRITSWEGYLKIQNKNADIEDIEATFSKPRFHSEYSHVTMKLSGLDKKQWKQLKNLSARVRGYHQDLGTVAKVHRGEQSVEIELKPDMARLARKNELQFEHNQIEFSNAATKSQLQRLLRGFERLKEGLAANPNLERILFEDKPKIAERTKTVELDFHNNLNEFQRAAVEGAMSAEDLYVIQGPPGTGKTTVISEICYQNAKAGLKTLVASQSNLAVDNALSRLLSNKDIRILRYGRTESIEEEGKKFIEENVAEYWKTVTTAAVAEEMNRHETKEQQLQTAITETKRLIHQLEERKQALQLEVEQKQVAQQRMAVIDGLIAELKKQLVQAKKDVEQQEALLTKLGANAEKIQQLLKPTKEELTQYDSRENLQKTITDAKEKLDILAQELELAQVLQERAQVEQQLTRVTQQLDAIGGEAGIEAQAEEINDLKKVVDVENYIAERNLRRSFVIDRLLLVLGERQQQIEPLKPIKSVMDRIDKAIHYCEAKLGIHVQPPALPVNHTYSIQEVEQFLNKLSEAIRDRKINTSNGSRSVQGLHLRKAFILLENERYQNLKNDTMIIFSRLKEGIIEVIKEQRGANEQVVSKLKDEQHRLKGKLTVSAAHLESLTVKEARSVEIVQNEQQQVELAKKQAANLLTTVDELTASMQQQEQDVKRLQTEIEATVKQLEATSATLKEVNAQGLAYEKEKARLELITKLNPEHALADTDVRMQDAKQEINKLQQQIELLPITQQLQNEWHSMLETANDLDLDEIRKLYVKHANVIGTTCVASANREFMDNYPTFDVVIIDEVSKATPPELLLPMLKGAKIILVGDHHQLPPLIGDETFEETLEQVVKESDTFEQKRELEKLLEESLFERLYKNLPSSNKTMLAIQYRMHDNIMQTIAPFYKQEADELQCGLEDSDATRDHLLETPTFSRNNHLLWLDVPNEQKYFEQRMQEGSSLYNDAELAIVRRMLVEVNEATKQVKQQGLLAVDTLKSVGVISFYAEQVKRINRLIDELALPHLHIRTGSVDKFQGMEMDLIFVSMVRNNGGNGEIGFAKDYRRLNVALSRAREMLAMIGSTEMFTQKPKQANVREMYRHVLKTAKAQDGYRAFEEI